MRKSTYLLLAALVALLSASAGIAFAHPEHDGAIDAEDGALDLHQHGDGTGHLPATQENVSVVSKLRLQNAVPEKIADVGVFKGYAYLAAWGNVTCENNGVHVVDIRNPAAPQEVKFIRSKPGSYPGEGIQVLNITTPQFSGDVLISNNEKCNERTGYGGINLYDVTQPTRALPLFEGAGDTNEVNGVKRKQANESHSAFAWDAGDKAYVVVVDNVESTDVDIFDITDPRSPRQIADLDLAERFPQILQNAPSNLNEVLNHDVIVKPIDGRQVMLVSYWDAGYVALNVNDPANPTYIADTDFANPDPELFQQTGKSEKPEGNAHQAEFTLDNRYVIAADEDFSPNGTEMSTDDDPTLVTVSQGSNTRQLVDGETLNGQTVYGGRACSADAAVPAAPAGGTYIAVVTRGACTFSEKIASVERAGGYAGAIVVNREGGCVGFGMSAEGGIPAVSLDRKSGYGLFDREALYDEAACRAGGDTLAGSLIPGVNLGDRGDVVNIRAFFDGWGYVHVYRNGSGKLVDLDTYAIPEAMDPAKSSGFGDLSVHEVATSERRADLAYFSYYSGGVRVAEISRTGKLQEVGRFIDSGGSNFWGVQVFQQGNKEYVAASDRDFGLYILQYTGRQ